jgi:uncharacterized protein (TIGR03435 family)
MKFIVLRIASLLALVLCSRIGLAQAARGNAPTQIQDVSPAVPELEVVSIRPGKVGLAMRSFNFLQNGVSFRGITTKMLIQYAFVVNPDRILGIPRWADSEEYDFEARVNDASEFKWRMLPINQQRLAILPILRNRFNLRYHHETKTLPVWALVVAKGGPKLHKATPGDPYTNGLKGPDGPLGAGAFRMSEPGQLTAQATTIEGFLWVLGNQLPGATPPDSATIVDKTGLTGRYDITLRFTPENSFASMNPGSETGAPAPSSPSLFTALQEQLGLKLESQKVPTDVIVIDHIDRPSEN